MPGRVGGHHGLRRARVREGDPARGPRHAAARREILGPHYRAGGCRRPHGELAAPSEAESLPAGGVLLSCDVRLHDKRRVGRRRNVRNKSNLLMKNQLTQFAASGRGLLQRLVRATISFITRPDGLRYSSSRGAWVTRQRTWCSVWVSQWAPNRFGRWEIVKSSGRDISPVPKAPPALIETNNQLRASRWFGRFWRIIDVEADHIAHYRILPSRVGLVLKVATDGTPWTLKGKRYHVAISGASWQFALGKYAVGILWRVPVPNPRKLP